MALAQNQIPYRASLMGREAFGKGACDQRPAEAAMPIESMRAILEQARSGQYAVCYCEAWNLESLQAVVEAAEETRSPIITGFNGGFLMHPARERPANLAYYAGMLLAVSRASVPIAYLLNETDSLSQIEQGIGLGFNSVMVENANLKTEEYHGLVKRVVRMGHDRGVSVEGQIGRLADGSGHAAAEVTDPLKARCFVEETAVDALGVAVGNVHILTNGKARIDLETLERIHDSVKIPLVLHGGTGIPLDTAPEYIRCGVAKVNYGTVLKQAYLEAVRSKLAVYRPPMNPHPFLGMGGREDILIAGLEAVKCKVKELLMAFG